MAETACARSKVLCVVSAGSLASLRWARSAAGPLARAEAGCVILAQGFSGLVGKSWQQVLKNLARESHFDVRASLGVLQGLFVVCWKVFGG